MESENGDDGRAQLAKLPEGLRVPEGKSLVLSCSQLLERTKSGLMLNLEYRDGERWQELSVDLVSGYQQQRP